MGNSNKNNAYLSTVLYGGGGDRQKKVYVLYNTRSRQFFGFCFRNIENAIHKEVQPFPGFWLAGWMYGGDKAIVFAILLWEADAAAATFPDQIFLGREGVPVAGKIFFKKNFYYFCREVEN